MRSTLIFGIAALASIVGCGSNAKPADADKIDTLSANGDVTHSLVANAQEPLTRTELSAFRRPPSVSPVVYPAGVAALISGPARWDAYLKGDTAALSPAELRGLILFTRDGCTTCHDGISLGGRSYRRLGEVVPVGTLADSGRYRDTHDPADLFVYRVASLRNVQLTPPYLHDGSVKSLGEAVRLMSRHQLGVDLTEDQVSDIRAYLVSLTGRLPYSGEQR